MFVTTSKALVTSSDALVPSFRCFGMTATDVHHVKFLRCGEGASPVLHSGLVSADSAARPQDHRSSMLKVGSMFL